MGRGLKVSGIPYRAIHAIGGPTYRIPHHAGSCVPTQAPVTNAIREVAFPMLTPNGIALSADGNYLIVRGKGSKMRAVPFGQWARAKLDRSHVTTVLCGIDPSSNQHRIAL